MSLNSGLQALYHFTGNYNDDSGNSNNATNNGTSLTTDKNSISNQAIDFNGSSDYVQTPIKVNVNTGFTISMWINPDLDASLEGLYCDILSSARDGISLRRNTSNFIECSGYVANVGVFTVVGTTAITAASGWNHIVFSYANNGDVAIYVNGVLDVTGNGTLTSIDLNGRFGEYYQNFGSRFYNGQMDECRIYDRALTQYEINQLYYSYDTDKNQVGILREDLEVEYHFSGNTNDSSGNGYNATNNGATLTTDKNSVSNQAYDFNGTTNYMSLGTTTDFGFNVGSVSVWFKPDAVGTTQYLYSKRTGVNRSWFGFIHTDNKFYFGLRDNSDTAIGTVTSTNTLSNGTWYNFTVTWDGSTIKLYQDGVLDTSAAQTGIVSTDAAQTYIGAREADVFFDGVIDEFKLSPRAITDTEVQMLYQGYDTTETSIDTLTGELEALYHFTGNVNDSSGNGNDGTNNGAVLTTDKNAVSNQAYLFNGATHYIDSNFSPTSLTAFTASIYINVDNTPTANEYFFGATTGTLDADKTNIWLRANTTSDISLGTRNSTGTPKNILNEGSITPTEWSSVIAKYDGSTLFLYQDGVLLNTLSATGTFNVQYDFSIGGLNDKGSTIGFFDGKLDEFRFYSRDLTQDEIIEVAYNYDVPTMAEDSAGPGPAPSDDNAINHGTEF